MRSPWTMFTRVGVATLLFTIGCGAEPAPADAKAKTDEKPADKAEPNKPAEPTKPIKPEVDVPPAIPPIEVGLKPGPGFTVGPPPATNTELADTLEPLPPIDNSGIKLLVSAQQTTVEEKVGLVLRARVELPAVSAPNHLNHERAVEVPEYGVERLELDTNELAKLPDGRWVVDVMLILMNGEDVIVSSTEHSVILVDATNQTARLLWSGADRGTSEFGACITMTEHTFALVGEELVVSKSDSVEWDAEMAAEMDMSADDCTAKPKTTVEAARVKLAGA
jgi:hypothetical protein